MTAVARTGDDTRDAILDAAERLLTEEGPEALTVRRIAAEAGGSTMNVYSRFGGKDGVVEALFREGFRRLAAGIEAAPTTGDAVADLARCGAAYRRFALANPTFYGVMFLGSVPDFEAPLEAKAEAYGTLELLGHRVQRAIDAGALPPGDAMAYAADLWAANHGLVSLELLDMGPHIDWEARHPETLAALVRGLAAVSPPDESGRSVPKR